ncbi:MAG: methyltransferase domain-containing protein [Anaerolineae bacterium]|nr:methyltransferase domain-containing protein [Anaerolineae bacterium]NIN95013.1 methyltransferase domain-containing protein [Anaerolineae bacterium]NIQ78052.1 methyltransferase domain-containing protein [Anaerolineae bacterium]
MPAARDCLIDYDRIASEYARHRYVHPEVLRDLLSTSGLESASRVLEVGCGTGNYITAVEESALCECWGIDPSAEMLAKATDRSPRVRFHHGDAEELDFPSDFFNLVFSVDVIHHMTDRRAYFAEVRRVLRSGGKVCTVTDSEWIIRHRPPLAIYFPETVEVDLSRYPRISQLRALMEEAAFKEITEDLVAFPYELTDIQAYRDKAFSSLHLISEEAFQEGIERLERNLESGPIPCVSRYVLLWGTKAHGRG